MHHAGLIFCGRKRRISHAFQMLRSQTSIFRQNPFNPFEKRESYVLYTSYRGRYPANAGSHRLRFPGRVVCGSAAELAPPKRAQPALPGFGGADTQGAARHGRFQRHCGQLQLVSGRRRLPAFHPGRRRLSGRTRRICHRLHALSGGDQSGHLAGNL